MRLHEPGSRVHQVGAKCLHATYAGPDSAFPEVSTIAICIMLLMCNNTQADSLQALLTRGTEYGVFAALLTHVAIMLHAESCFITVKCSPHSEHVDIHGSGTPGDNLG